MTLKEINLVLKCYGENLAEERKKELCAQYNVAYMTSTFVGCILNGKTIPSINQLFPNDFAEDIEIDDEERINLSTALYKEQLLDYANAHNIKRRVAKEGEKRDD